MKYKKYRVSSQANASGKQYVYTNNYNTATFVPSGCTFLFANAVLVSGNTDYVTSIYPYANSVIVNLTGTGTFEFDVYVFYK